MFTSRGESTTISFRPLDSNFKKYVSETFFGENVEV